MKARETDVLETLLTSLPLRGELRRAVAGMPPDRSRFIADNRRFSDLIDPEYPGR
jgi:hypothetical protein